MERNAHRQVFVATGTGASAVPARMFERDRPKAGEIEDVELYFG